MKIRKILPILILTLFVSTTADAQRRRTRRKKVEKVEETIQQKMYKEMLPSTQKIVFVDSVNAKKDDFMKHIKLSKDIGSIVPYTEFFNKPDSTGCYGFVNGFGNKCYISVPTKDGIKLYTADKLYGKWKNERELNELNEFAQSANYPYLMTDGMTLYFSAKSEEKSLGGYDIFVTSFDSDSGTFLEPQNIGLPFNSPANDYMLVIDDVNKVGWFVTDRNKTDDNVTVYTFVPNDVRKNYDIEELGEEKVERFARIHSYMETSTKEMRTKVLDRIKSISSNSKEKNSNAMSFAINNNTVYHSPNDFKSKKAQDMYYKMYMAQQRIEEMDNIISEKRIKFHLSREGERSKMAPEILKMEKEFEQLLDDVKQMHKDIINEENKTLNKKG